MSTTEIVILVVVAGLFLLIVGNVVFSMLSERNNRPIGSFIECDGVRLHYLDRGDPSAPCVVLFHGNGMMIQDFIISGLLELLARRHRVLCFDRPGFGHSKRPRARVWTATNQAALFVNALNQLAVVIPWCWAIRGVPWSPSRWACEVTILFAVLCLRPATTFRPGAGTSGSCQVRPYPWSVIWSATRSPRLSPGSCYPGHSVSFSHLARSRAISSMSFRLH